MILKTYCVTVKCNLPCSGNQNQMCGGENTFSAYVAGLIQLHFQLKIQSCLKLNNQNIKCCLECETGYKRFGGNCYKDEGDSTLADALETCNSKGTMLWAPKKHGEEVMIPAIFG